MNDPVDAISESARAIQEASKSAGKLLDITKEAGTFISKYISGTVEQGIGIFEDKLKYYRWERQQRMMIQAEAVMKELGIVAPTRSIPLKIAIPLFEAAAIEDDNDLQDQWIGLLVNYANADSGVELNRVYVEILSEISSLEAKILDAIYLLPFNEMQHTGVATFELPNMANIIKENCDASQLLEPNQEVKLAIANLSRLGCLKQTLTFGGGESFKKINPTFLGKSFVDACRVKLDISKMTV